MRPERAKIPTKKRRATPQGVARIFVFGVAELTLIECFVPRFTITKTFFRLTTGNCVRTAVRIANYLITFKSLIFTEMQSP